MSSNRQSARKWFVAARGLVMVLALFSVSGIAAQPSARQAPQVETIREQVPPLLLAGGRRLEYVRSISSESQVRPNRGFWNKVVDWVAGPPEFRAMVRPYGLAVDSTGRLIVTDPGASSVHILDFEKQKYEQLNPGKGRAFASPMGVAIDSQDTIYITDSESAAVFVFNAKGKLQRVIGGANTKNKVFDRPTGISIDDARKLLYVSDTLRHQVVLLDLNGNVVRRVGTRGRAPGQFNFPTELAFRGEELLVVDAMNFRIQAFSRDGDFLRSFGTPGATAGTLFRPKGMALDREGNIYVADAILETVQAFDRDGRLLYFFGRSGARAGEFQLPAGVFIDSRNRIYVADSMNRRVQVFQFRSATRAAAGGAR